MERIEVNVLTKEVRNIPLTELEIADAQARAAMENENQTKEKMKTEIESLIESKMREIAIAALKAEGKLTVAGELIRTKP